MREKIKVSIIGAGPGDARLLTLGAKEAISCADVIIYDNLVNEEVLSHASSSCEVIYAGKSGSTHTMEQAEINSLISARAMEGRKVVRLKGGDPFIFGRGGEEALHLAGLGIEFEVLCGISSAYAVPAYAGIPVTHRGISASVAFITGHEDPSKNDTDIRWDRISTGVQTLVFLMGVKNLPFIVKNLVDNGRSPDTPAAVIESGTYPSQRTVTAPLSRIFDTATQAGIRPPSVFVVGDVVSLREKLNWFERRPLFGKRIVVTRAREQASSLTEKLRSLGANVTEIPSIRIMPAEDVTPLKKAIVELSVYDWIIFTSVNGVEMFFTHLAGSSLDSRALHGVKVCAIGTATAERISRQGVIPDLIPGRFISQEILSELESRNEIAGRAFLLPRADIAPRAFADSLREKGAARVDDICAYRTAQEELPEGGKERETLKGKGFDLVTFTSSSTVRNFAAVLHDAGVESFEGITCASIGPVTTETAINSGFTVLATSEVHTIDGLVETIIGIFTQGH